MSTADKELLLKDLCARLPYDVKVEYNNINCEILLIDKYNEELTIRVCPGYSPVVKLENVKPYLFPLSSMTEEQKRELLTLTGYEARCEESCGFDSWGFYVNIVGEYTYEDNQESIILYPDDIGIDWLNKNHFDYRGLIPKGLAMDATGLNIY